MGVFKRMRDFMNYWYMQYILCTSLYMLEPMERKILNSILVATIAMGIYTTYLFLPGHAIMMIHYMEYYFSAEAGGIQGLTKPLDTPPVSSH